MRNRNHRQPLDVLLLLLAGLCGCESPGWMKSLQDAFGSQSAADYRAEEQYRRKYLANRDPQALNWLLAHRIQSGMSVDDVQQVLGEEAERETNDKWIKPKQGMYRIDDEVYRFGPDHDGRSVYLAFREGRLVNFEPEEFKGKGRPTAE